MSNFQNLTIGLMGVMDLESEVLKKFDHRIRSQMSKIGCARAVRLRQCAFLPVFALSAIPIYTKVCNIKGQISARV